MGQRPMAWQYGRQTTPDTPPRHEYGTGPTEGGSVCNCEFSQLVAHYKNVVMAAHQARLALLDNGARPSAAKALVVAWVGHWYAVHEGKQP